MNGTDGKEVKNGAALNTTFYVNESVARTPKYFVLSINTNKGTVTKRIAMTKWNRIARNDYLIIPVKLVDYRIEIEPQVFTGIGVKPELNYSDDRFLAGAEAYRVPVIIVFNKCDLLSEQELHYEKMMRTLYETIGYKCVEISAATGEGVDELRPLIKDKKSLLSGNSGVGKSTLINQLIPDAAQRTAEISEAHNSGMHTTTFSEMLDLPEGGYLIDTPGIKGFGTFDIEKEELTSYFKEIFKFSQDCKFSDCTHTHEPGCAVIKAVENHYIAASRYQSYLSMLEDKDENKYREAF